MNLEGKLPSAYKHHVLSSQSSTVDTSPPLQELLEALPMKAHEECLKQFKVILQRSWLST